MWTRTRQGRELREQFPKFVFYNKKDVLCVGHVLSFKPLKGYFFAFIKSFFFLCVVVLSYPFDDA